MAIKLVDYSSVALTDSSIRLNLSERGLKLIESLAGVEALVVFADDVSGELKWKATSQLMTKLVMIKN